MADFQAAFNDRVAEIDAYLDLLTLLEKQVQTGPPRINGADTATPITALQQKILYSTVFLQLYNLVESTVNNCITAVANAVTDQGKRWRPADLSEELRSEWVRYVAQTNVDLNYENRLKASVALCEHLVRSLPIDKFEVLKGGGGSWDDESIYRICERLGCQLVITPATNKAVKERIRNDKGALAVIKQCRNDLAHGSLSFAECAGDMTVRDLRDLSERTIRYLREVMTCFQQHIDGYEFILINRRPTQSVPHSS